jgi:hypothetical protein
MEPAEANNSTIPSCPGVRPRTALASGIRLAHEANAMPLMVNTAYTALRAEIRRPRGREAWDIDTP